MLGLGLGLLGAGIAGSIGQGIMGGKAASQKEAAGKRYAGAMKGISDDYERYRQAQDDAKMQAMRQEMTAWQPAMAQMESMYGPGSVPDYNQLFASPISEELRTAHVAPKGPGPSPEALAAQKMFEEAMRRNRAIPQRRVSGSPPQSMPTGAGSGRRQPPGGG